MPRVVDRPIAPLKFSANLSFLFSERQFVERFAAAHAAGFDAVEFHFPYAEDQVVLAEVALTSGVEVALFNLPAGTDAEWTAGQRGIAADPHRMAEFQDGVGLAIEYATTLGCPRLNCLAGIPPHNVAAERAREILVENLRFASSICKRAGIQLLIEPLNTHDTPGFLVPTTAAAVSIIDLVGSDNLALQYDIYHAQVMEGDLARTIERHLPKIGHIQLADNPGRHEPGSGEVNFPFLLGHLQRLGYSGWVGCEYRPSGDSEDSFAWMEGWR
jgi:hydroxypyruvate isomerase